MRPHIPEDLLMWRPPCGAGKRSLLNGLIDHFRKAADRPLLLAYSAGSTPVQTKLLSFGSGEGVVRRSGYTMTATCVHNCFALLTCVEGQPQACACLRDPAPMNEGNTASAHVAIGTAFLRGPREDGHAGSGCPTCCL